MIWDVIEVGVQADDLRYGTFTCLEHPFFEQFVINVVHRRRDGFILAHFIAFGTDIFAHGQGIDAGERLPFRLDVPDKLPADGWYEVYARPWYDMEDRLPVRE